MTKCHRIIIIIAVFMWSVRTRQVCFAVCMCVCVLRFVHRLCVSDILVTLPR